VRAGPIVAGLLIFIVGWALWYFPIQAVSTGAVSEPSGATDIVGVGGAPLIILGSSIPYNLKWSSGPNVTVNVYDCSTDSTCALATSGSPITHGNGSAGSLSWSGGHGQYFAVVPSGGAATLAVTYTTPLLEGAVGLGGVVLGFVMIILGILLRSPRGPETIVVRPPVVTTTVERNESVTEPLPPPG
jgi:hypothetical protein